MKMHVILVLLLCVPALAVNVLTETFDGAFDLPWTTWNPAQASFSEPAGTYDISGSSASPFCGVYMASFDTIGSGGGWALEANFKDATVSGADGDIEVTQKIKVNTGFDTDFRVFFLIYPEDETAIIIVQLHDATGSSLALPNVDLGSVTLPMDYTSFIECTVTGPGNWQCDFFYDIGEGKTFIGSFTDEELSGSSSFDPSWQEIRTELYQYTHGGAVSSVSIDNYTVTSLTTIAYDPVPADGAALPLVLIPELAWQNPGVPPTCPNDIYSLDVWYGTDPNMDGATKIVDDEPITTAASSTTNFTAAAGQTYYWRVDIHDPNTCDGGSAYVRTGDIWSFSVLSTGGATNYSDSVQVDPNLLSYYPFDTDVEDANSITDIEPAGHDGTIAGSGSTDQDLETGLIGAKSLNLTENSWVQFGAVSDFDFAVAGIGTVECLLKPEDDFVGKTKGTLFTMRSAFSPGKASYDWAITENLDSMNFFSWGTTTGLGINPGASKSFNQDQWYHVAIVYDEGVIEDMYVNGVGLKSGATALGDTAPGVVPVQFGSILPDSKDQGWIGNVDELAVYDRAVPAGYLAYRAFLAGTYQDRNPQAYGPTPLDGAELLPTELSWIDPNSRCEGDTISVDVWLGKLPDLSDAVKIVDKQPVESVGSLTLDPITDYYWRVDVYDPTTCVGEEIMTPGLVWTFKTVSVCEPVPTADLTGDCKVNLADLGVMAGQWLDCNLLPSSFCD